MHNISTVCHLLTCRVSKGVLKRDVLDIYLATSFAVVNFGKTEAMMAVHCA